MIPIGKHFGLMRQIGPATVNQVKARQAILARDFLRPQMLFDRHRVIGAAFDGGIIADHHAFPAVDTADAGDETRTVNSIVVHAVGGERRELQKRRTGVNQIHDTIAGQQFPPAHMALTRLFRAAQSRLGAPFLQVGH